MAERNPRTRAPKGGIKEALAANVKRQQRRAPVTASPGTSPAKKKAAKRRAEVGRGAAIVRRTSRSAQS